MSEIGGPQKPDFTPPESPNRVTPASTTSDQGTRQDPSGQPPAPPGKTADGGTTPPHHDPAVTLAASLLHLQPGSSFAARTRGLDGEGRQILVTENAHYLVQSQPEIEAALAQLPADTRVMVRINQADKDIRATLYPVPGEQHADLPDHIRDKIFQPAEVELMLIRVKAGFMPPAGQAAPSSAAGPHYQASPLYRAEQIARHMSRAMKNFPLPTSAAAYTLFEKAAAAPGASAPAVTPTAPPPRESAASPLLAQDLAATPPAPDPARRDSILPANMGSVNVDNVELNSLLHRDLAATVVRTYPSVLPTLPDYVAREIGQDRSLERLRPGSRFTLRIHSVAIPQAPPGLTFPTSPAAPTSVTSPASLAEPDSAAPSASLISGIILAPTPPAPDEARPAPVAGNASPPPPPKARERIHHLATPTAVIRLRAAADLSPGTIVSFAPVPHNPDRTPEDGTTPPDRMLPTAPGTTPSASPSIAPPTAPDAATGPPPAGLPVQPLDGLLQNWLALDEMLAILAAQPAPAAHALMMTRLPDLQAPQQMSSTLLFFMAALGAPQPARAWLGPEVSAQMQKAGQQKLLQQLDNDMRRIARLGADTSAGEWRPVLLPAHLGGEVTALPLIIRHSLPDRPPPREQKKDRDEPPAAPATTRFVLDITLTRHGHLVLDGMLREKRLDIMLKSEKVMTERMKNDLTMRFRAALDGSDFAGELLFRDGRTPDISARRIIDSRLRSSDLNQLII